MQVLILGRWRKDQIWAQKLEMSTKRFEGTPSSSVVWQQVKNSVCNGWSLYRPKNILRHKINNWILLCVRASSWTTFFLIIIFSSPFVEDKVPTKKIDLQKWWRSKIQINQDMYKVAIIFLINYHSDNLDANPTAVTSTLPVILYSNSSIAIYQYCNFHHWTNIINLM